MTTEKALAVLNHIDTYAGSETLRALAKVSDRHQEEGVITDAWKNTDGDILFDLQLDEGGHATGYPREDVELINRLDFEEA